MEIYDVIGENYKKQTRSSVKRKFTADYTFLYYLGDVRGKSILDLACGEGYYSRIIKQAGAAEVFGSDISSKMIAFAKSEEARHPLGIRHACYDVIRLPVIGKFDIVTAPFLLHYSRTRDELFKMCKNIYANLKEGGKLIGLNSSPDSPLQPDKRYDSTRTCDQPLAEGCAIKVALTVDGQPACSFDNYHWEKATYEDALKSAGFENIKWHSIMVSQEGLAKFGSQFWEDYLKQPGIIVFACRKH